MFHTGRPIGTVPVAGMPRAGSCQVTSTAASVGPVQVVQRPAGQAPPSGRPARRAAPRRWRTPAAATPPRRGRRSPRRRRGTPRASTARSAGWSPARRRSSSASSIGSRWAPGAASTTAAPWQSGQNSSHTETSNPVGVFCSTRSSGPRGQLVLHPRQPVGDGPVRDRHALRPPGRARREDHVRRVVEPGRRRVRRPLARGGRRAGSVSSASVDVSMSTAAPASATMTAAPLGRQVGVERDVGGARPQHADQRHHQLDRPAEGDGHHRLRPDAPAGQAGGDGVGPGAAARRRSGASPPKTTAGRPGSPPPGAAIGSGSVPRTSGRAVAFEPSTTGGRSAAASTSTAPTGVAGSAVDLVEQGDEPSASASTVGRSNRSAAYSMPRSSRVARRSRRRSR